jgi:hypothetical protein
VHVQARALQAVMVPSTSPRADHSPSDNGDAPSPKVEAAPSLAVVAQLVAASLRSDVVRLAVGAERLRAHPHILEGVSPELNLNTGPTVAECAVTALQASAEQAAETAFAWLVDVGNGIIRLPSTASHAVPFPFPAPTDEDLEPPSTKNAAPSSPPPSSAESDKGMVAEQPESKGGDSELPSGSVAPTPDDKIGSNNPHSLLVVELLQQLLKSAAHVVAHSNRQCVPIQ